MVKWICDKLKITYYTVGFSWVFFSLKGFLIAFPVGGIINAILWPLGYRLGYLLKNHTVSELLSGLGAGISVLVWYKLIEALL